MDRSDGAKSVLFPSQVPKLQVNLEDFDLVTDGSVYGSFSFVLGFTLVFRCQQAYQRYFNSAKCLHMMSEASCLRATAIQLCNEVLVWIKVMIVQGIDSGILAAKCTCMLSIPPPILTRVYQEIGAGMGEFHDAQLISMWPFPFPYAQLSLFLTFLHMIISPLIMVQYTKHIFAACFLTCVSVVSVISLNIISLELENPFGDDINDLPAHEVHDHFRDSLLVLADPDNWQVPRLLPTASLDFGTLKKRRDSQRNTISEFLMAEDKLQGDTFEEVRVIAEDEDVEKDKFRPERAPEKGPERTPQQSLQNFSNFQILEKGLERQAALLEVFLAKQNDILEHQAHLMKCLESNAKAHRTERKAHGAENVGPVHSSTSRNLGPSFDA
eukprot:Skav221504  [mRNA]  locus=scaffold2743:130782:135216:- [translate_table: standard]